MKNNIYYILLILTLFISISVLNLCRLSQLEYAILMCSVFSIGLVVLWKKSQITPFFLFLVTFSFLFIGGRFWAFLISPDEGLFDLQRGTFLIRESIKTPHFTSTLVWVICFFILAIYGYFIKKRKTSLSVSFPNFQINRTLKLLFWPLAAFSLLVKIFDFKYALENGGYLAMYEGQNETYSSFSSLGTTVLYILWGMSFVFGDKQVKRRYFILLFLYTFITILIGSRGAFGSFLMFALWIYSLKKKIKIIKLTVIGGFLFTLLLFVFSFSIRESGAGDVSETDALSAFLYSQGVTLLVFDQTRDVASFPVVAYFQAFIPGATFLYTHLFNPSAYPYDLTFDAYISNLINPKEYANGHAVGWSILGDVYVFSGGNILIFALLSILFGMLCAYIENNCSKKPFFAVLVYAVFLKFMILPRAGINTIVPFIWYIAVLYLLIVIFPQILRKKSI